MYQYRKTRFSKHLDFLISDIFAFELSLFLAYMFRFGRNPIAVKAYGYTEISALIVLVNLIVAFFLESYSGILKRDNVNDIKFAKSAYWFFSMNKKNENLNVCTKRRDTQFYVF